MYHAYSASSRELSSGPKQLIVSMLAAAPERRLSASQALGHPWLKSGKKQLLAAEQLEAGVQQAAAAALPVEASAAVAQIDLSDASLF